MKEPVLKKFDSERKALRGYESLEVYKDSNPNESFFKAGMVIGKYRCLYPVFIDYYSSMVPGKGWMCFIVDEKKYQVVLNRNLKNLYLNQYADREYFGVKYIYSKNAMYRLTKKSFKEEFLLEQNKEKEKRKGPATSEQINEDDFYKIEFRTCIKNFYINLDYMKKLSNLKYQKELMRICDKFHFEEISTTTGYNNCLYILALDKYSQFYVGKVVHSLTNRTRKHWEDKIIPSRQIWIGGESSSRIKIDNFKMLDTKRIFVCKDYKKVLEENKSLSESKDIWKTTNFMSPALCEMNDLDIAERVVIDNCRCMFCLSDRIPLPTNSEIYDICIKLEIPYEDLLIKNYIFKTL